jgi:hypothetical protein
MALLDLSNAEVVTPQPAAPALDLSNAEVVSPAPAKPALDLSNATPVAQPTIGSTRVKVAPPTLDDILSGKTPASEEDLKAAGDTWKKAYALDMMTKSPAERAAEGLSDAGTALSNISPAKIMGAVGSGAKTFAKGVVELASHPIEGFKPAMAGLASSAVKGVGGLTDLGMAAGQKALEYGTAQAGVTPEWAANSEAEVAWARKMLGAGIALKTDQAKANTTTDNTKDVANMAEGVGDIAQIAAVPGIGTAGKALAKGGSAALKMGGKALGALAEEEAIPALKSTQGIINKVASTGAGELVPNILAKPAGLLPKTAEAVGNMGDIVVGAGKAEGGVTLSNIAKTASAQVEANTKALAAMEDTKAALMENPTAHRSDLTELGVQMNTLGSQITADKVLGAVASSDLASAGVGTAKLLANMTAGAGVGAVIGAARGSDVNEAAANGALAAGALHLTSKMFSGYRPAKAALAEQLPPNFGEDIINGIRQKSEMLDRLFTGAPSAAEAAAKTAQAGAETAVAGAGEAVAKVQAKLQEIKASNLKPGTTVTVDGAPLTVTEAATKSNPAILHTEDGLGVPVLPSDTIHVDSGSLKAPAGSALAGPGFTSSTVDSIDRVGDQTVVSFKRRNGAAPQAYSYDAPYEVHEGLMDAPSKGTFVNKTLKKYPVAKSGEKPLP